jgi:RNA polymerase sigma-70 factor, ECF subfamily
MVDAALGAHSEPLAGTQRDAAGTRIRAMVDAYFHVVWRSLRRLGVEPGAVDDAAQQVFLVATRKLDGIEPDGERAYLLGIAVRVASDARRARRRRREVPDTEDLAAEQETSVPSAEELVDQKRARVLLDQVLATMPEELRDVFVLFEVEGIGVAQIATSLGIPVGTVGSRIRRARELFHKRVGALARSTGSGGAP